VQRERDVRIEAEQKRLRDLDDARRKSERKLEEKTHRLRRELEEAVKKEGARVETLIRAEGDSRVEEERKAGQQRLERAVRAAEERAREEERQAVQKARSEEKAAAAEEAARVAKDHERQMEEAIRLADQTLQDALEKQRRELLEESRKAVQSAVGEADKKAAETLKTVQRNHEVRVSELRLQLEGLMQELEKTRQAVSCSESMRKDAEIKLAQMTAEFSHFINQMPGYSADYLLK
jgi:hypothetical protein